MSKYSLLDETDNWLTRPKFGAPRQATLYPSEASVEIKEEDGTSYIEGTCLRAAFLRVTGKETPAKAEARGEYIMSIGKTIEEWLMDRWKEMGIWVSNNTKFYWSEYNVSGELDAILVEPHSGDPYGVEVKTFYGYDAHKHIIGNKSHAGFPKINQLLQTLVYTYFFRDRLKYFKMIYVARDDIERKEFTIEVQEENGKWWPVIDGNLFKKFSIDDMLARYKLLNYHIQNDIMPPRDYELVWDTARVEREKAKGNVSKTAYAEWEKGKRKIGDWQCRYCAYKLPCWKEELVQLPEGEDTTPGE